MAEALSIRRVSTSRIPRDLSRGCPKLGKHMSGCRANILSVIGISDHGQTAQGMNDNRANKGTLSF